MKTVPLLTAVAALFCSLAAAQGVPQGPDFRVLPYLQWPACDAMSIRWFTTTDTPGEVRVTGPNGYDSGSLASTPETNEWLTYHAIEEADRGEFPDMFQGGNYRHTIRITGLTPGGEYHYTVKQGASIFEDHFRTPPAPDAKAPLRIIAFADSETDPEGRGLYREWVTGKQTANSTGRPEGMENYLVTETEGFIENLRVIRERKPDFMILAGDIVQGGGYQRAWDEFFFHMAGKFDTTMSHTPLIAAIGNWENFGARVGEYEPWAIRLARKKFQAYFEGAPNNNANFRGFYHRVDYGPVTLLTLDSSNGLPDFTDNDTNTNIVEADYPGEDLVDLAPGSDQWNWTMEQLADARAKGQIIFVQFHHIPYSSGWHSLPVTMEESSGQAGTPMRAYTPYFQKYGVVAVICGHCETFERSEVGGILFYDTGVAGDGLGEPYDEEDPRRANPWQKWIAHNDAPEEWKGKQLIDGGRHYGHLEIDLKPTDDGYTITFTPVYIFPVNDENGTVTGFERRVYNDVVEKDVPFTTELAVLQPKNE